MPIPNEGDIIKACAIACLCVSFVSCAGSPAMAQRPQARMILVKGGTYMMGSPEREPRRVDDEALHAVSLSDFLLSSHEVSFSEYDAYCAETGREPPGDNGWGRGLMPVINVSWYEAVVFCNWLSVREGLDPAYTLSGYQAELVTGANGYRLPSEAEWEYACRAGSTKPFSTGDTITSHQANFDGTTPYRGANSGPNLGRPVPGGSYPPNAWGFYDMHGNVKEWCWDYYGPYFGPFESALDVRMNPLGAPSGQYRVQRGGSWFSPGDQVRSAFRDGSSPETRNTRSGFRLARSVTGAEE